MQNGSGLNAAVVATVVGTLNHPFWKDFHYKPSIDWDTAMYGNADLVLICASRLQWHCRSEFEVKIISRALNRATAPLRRRGWGVIVSTQSLSEPILSLPVLREPPSLSS